MSSADGSLVADAGRGETVREKRFLLNLICQEKSWELALVEAALLAPIRRTQSDTDTRVRQTRTHIDCRISDDHYQFP